MKYTKQILVSLLLCISCTFCLGQDNDIDLQQVSNFPQLFQFCEGHKDFETIKISKKGMEMATSSPLKIELMYKITTKTPSNKLLEEFLKAIENIAHSHHYENIISLNNGNENLNIYILKSEFEIRKNRHEYLCILQDTEEKINIIYICGEITLEQINRSKIN